jgi:Uma2 family endonuclease
MEHPRAGLAGMRRAMFPSMAQPAEDRREALYEAYKKVPEHQHAEIIEGTLYVMPRPAPRHANATSVLAGELGGAFQRGRGGPGGWWILFEPELHLVSMEPMVPDIAGWRAERMPQLPETAFFTIVPDWICETLSPSTETIDRQKKLPIYARHGVKHVWIVDPVAKTLEVHSLGEDARWREVRIHQGDARVRAAPFEAMELDLGELWSGPKVASP